MQLPQTKTVDLLGGRKMEDEYNKMNATAANNNDDHTNDRHQISAGSSMAASELATLMQHQSNRQSALSSATTYANILRGPSSTMVAQGHHPSTTTSTMSNLLGSSPSSSLYSTMASSRLADRLGSNTGSFLTASSAATSLPPPSAYTNGYTTSSYPSSLSAMSTMPPSSSMALYRSSLPTTTTAAASMYPPSLAITPNNNMMAAAQSASLSPLSAAAVQYELALQSAMARTSAYHNAYSSLSNEQLLATNRMDASQSYLAAMASSSSGGGGGISNNVVLPSIPPLGGNPMMSSSSAYTTAHPSSLINPTARMLSDVSAASSSMLGNNNNNNNHSYALVGTPLSSKNNTITASPKASSVSGSRQSSDNNDSARYNTNIIVSGNGTTTNNNNNNNNAASILPAHYNHRMGMSNNDMNHPVRLVIPTDTMFLDSVHIFLRCHCIEIFVAGPDDMTYPGRGARPSKVGQVGLRCYFCRDMPKRKLTKQAICFPSKRDTIFESIRNFQRTHIPACPRMPPEVKLEYKKLTCQSRLQKRSQKYLKAYYAESAAELGIVDTKDSGLVFGTSVNTTGVPREALQSLIDAANNPSNASEYWNKYESTTGKAAQLRKFENVASEGTRRVIINARKEETMFVSTTDFAVVSDFEYILFHQVVPFLPDPEMLNSQREHEYVGSGGGPKLHGFCCKHCASAGDTRNHFPADLNHPADSSFIQRMVTHFLNCRHTPQDVKDAFEELKKLASEQGTSVKRGSRKRFVGRIWRKLQIYYGTRKADVRDSSYVVLTQL